MLLTYFIIIMSDVLVNTSTVFNKVVQHFNNLDLFKNIISLDYTYKNIMDYSSFYIFNEVYRFDDLLNYLIEYTCILKRNIKRAYYYIKKCIFKSPKQRGDNLCEKETLKMMLYNIWNQTKTKTNKYCSK